MFVHKLRPIQIFFQIDSSSFISADSKNSVLREGQNLSQHFPSFIWAVRDHHLKLEINGQVVTSQQYLEHCLTNKIGVSTAIFQYNQLRDAIRALFKERTCHVFPMPVSDPDKMNNLDSFEEWELAQEFRQAGIKSLAMFLNS